MKLATSKKVHYDSGPNMTPLVDIVMVILIFLMLTGTFAVGEHFMTQNTPISQRGTTGEAVQGLPQEEPLDIRVDSPTSDEWLVQVGVFAIKNSRDALRQKLIEMRTQFTANGIDANKVQVQISPGRGTKYKHLIEVFESALDAGFQKIAFTTAH